MTKQNNARGILLMLWASASFAVMAAGMKWIGSGLPASEVVFIRSLISSAAIAAFLLARKNTDWTGKTPHILAARGIVGFAALILYFWSIPRLHLGTAVMLNYTAPIFAVVTAHLLYKEKTPSIEKMLIGGAFLGVYLLTAPQMNQEPLALAAGLGAGFLVGLVHLLIRRSHDDYERPILIIFYFTITCTIGSALFWPFQAWPAPNLGQWAALIVITLSSFMGQLGLTYSLQKARVSVVSPFGYITPVIGLVIGFFVWRENPGLMGVAGSAVIILCGSVLYKRQV